MKKQCTVTFLIILLSIVAVQSQDVKQINERLERLEYYNKEIIDKRFENKSLELENAANKNFHELESEISQVDYLVWTFGIGSGIGIIGVLITIGITFYILFKKLETMVAEKFKLKIENILEDQKSTLLRIIDSNDYELNLKQLKNILILSKNKSDETFLKKFFATKEFRFKNPSFNLISEKNGSDYDLVIFNDELESLSEDEITESMKNYSKSVFLYYNTTRKFLKIPSEKINCTNSPFTIYSQVLNSLKFHDVFF